MPTAVIAGKSYNTVIMPDGKNWTAENLAWDGVGWDYKNDPSYRAEYGRYYDWWMIPSIKSAISGGWRVPNKADWDTLLLACGGTNALTNNLKESGSLHWNGTNSSDNRWGFSARGAGKIALWQNGTINIPGVSANDYAEFLMDDGGYSEYGNIYAYYVGYSSTQGIGYVSSTARSGCSVRLVRDASPNLYIQHNGEWNRPTDIYVPHGGVWKRASQIFVPNSGEWKQI